MNVLLKFGVQKRLRNLLFDMVYCFNQEFLNDYQHVSLSPSRR